MTINVVSIVFFVIAAVSLLVAIYTFIRFNIPQVIGELSGRTARKSIAQMRNNNIKTGNKAHRPTAAAVERGSLTDKIDDKPKPSKSAKKDVDSNWTVRLENSPYDDNATMPLSQNDMASNATEVLKTDDDISESTELLADNETTVLSNENIVPNASLNVKTEGFEIIKSIVLIHTDETI